MKKLSFLLLAGLSLGTTAMYGSEPERIKEIMAHMMRKREFDKDVYIASRMEEVMSPEVKCTAYFLNEFYQFVKEREKPEYSGTRNEGQKRAFLDLFAMNMARCATEGSHLSLPPAEELEDTPEK